MADLAVDERDVQWLTTAFLLTMAVVIPITGCMFERIPTRSAFLLALILFTTGTSSAQWLVFGLVLAGRIVQASGTAVMLLLLMTTVMQLVPPAHRGAIMGTLDGHLGRSGHRPDDGRPGAARHRPGGVFGLDGAGIGLIMLAIGAWRMVTVNEPMRVPLDAWSVPLTVLGFGGLVYGLSLIGDATRAAGRADRPVRGGGARLGGISCGASARALARAGRGPCSPASSSSRPSPSA